MMALLLASLVFLSGMLLSGLTVWLWRRRASLDFLKSHHDTLGHFVAILTALYGLLLAFVVMVLWERQNEARANTELEAELVHAQLRLASGFSDGHVPEIREHVLAYLQGVQREEWPEMLKRDSRFLSRQPKQLHRLWQEWMKIEPGSERESALYREAIQQFDALQQSRRLRIAHAEWGLPAYLWILLILGAGAIFICTLFIGMEFLHSQILLTSICGGWILVLFFVVYDMQNPFRGYWVVTDQPYSEIQRLIEDQTEAIGN